MVYPVFLSVVLPVRNQAEHIEKILLNVASCISSLVSDYELIVVDNASDDESLSVFKNLTGENGQPNVQVYALTRAIDLDTASWVGVENALGDFVVIFNSSVDDIDFLPEMLDKAVDGFDIVFANNQHKPPQSLAYKFAYWVFNLIYKLVNGINLSHETSHYRILSKRVVNFVLQHPHPSLAYRLLPTTGGFIRINLYYSTLPKVTYTKSLRKSIDYGMWMLISTTRAPMRIVTSLSLFGACANIVYSGYVVVIALSNPKVASGWASLSLQQSGMFFLISLVLFVLGEYILKMASLSNAGPSYHVGQEFTSVHMTQREKLNIAELYQEHQT